MKRTLTNVRYAPDGSIIASEQVEVIEYPSAEQSAAALARLSATERLATDDVPAHVAEALSGLFPDWFQPEGAHDAYPEGIIVRHDGTLWRSTTPDNVWEPGEAGWHRYGANPDDGPQPWVQPSGAADAYPAGAEVTHNGRTWRSDLDGNVWEPGVFGWTDIGPAP